MTPNLARVQFRPVSAAGVRASMRAANPEVPRISMMVEGTQQIILREGSYSVRVLPQPGPCERWPEGSENLLTRPIAYLYLDSAAERGYAALSMTQATRINALHYHLSKEPKARNFLRSRTNRQGWDPRPAWRELVQVVPIVPTPVVHALLLPSNGPVVDKAECFGAVQLGTQLRFFLDQQGVDGEAQYPDLYDIVAGRAITIVVTKDVAGKHQHSMTVAAPLDLSQAPYDAVIQQVRPHVDLVAYHPDDWIYSRVVDQAPAAIQPAVRLFLGLSAPTPF